jgi:hypothetical protein
MSTELADALPGFVCMSGRVLGFFSKEKLNLATLAEEACSVLARFFNLEREARQAAF